MQAMFDDVVKYVEKEKALTGTFSGSLWDTYLILQKWAIRFIKNNKITSKRGLLQDPGIKLCLNLKSPSPNINIVRHSLHV